MEILGREKDEAKNQRITIPRRRRVRREAQREGAEERQNKRFKGKKVACDE
jgi:hypothetical protein